jgi:arsenite methyltransferase
VRAFYDARTDYDNDETIARAVQLLAFYPPQPGATVIDFATGTGNVALAAAERVGPAGSVTGIDFSPVLLEQARRKAARRGLGWVRFLEVDVAEVPLEAASVDQAYCSFAIVLFEHQDLFLRKVRAALNPGGFLAFTSNSDRSYFNGFVHAAAAAAGITLPAIHDSLASPERIHATLTAAGYRTIEIRSLQRGRDLPLEEARAKWNGRCWLHPAETLQDLPEEQGRRIKQQFDHLLEANATGGTIWFEELIHHVRAAP